MAVFGIKFWKISRFLPEKLGLCNGYDNPAEGELIVMPVTFTGVPSLLLVQEKNATARIASVAVE